MRREAAFPCRSLVCVWNATVTQDSVFLDFEEVTSVGEYKRVCLAKELLDLDLV